MQLSHVKTVTKREYLARLKSKGFWISTIALPILMASWAILPGLMIAKTSAGQILAIVDYTGSIAEPLAAQLEEWSEQSSDLVGGSGQPVDFTLEIVPGCPEDSNGDGSVSSADLLTVLADWGEICGGNFVCHGDVNCDGQVNSADILDLLAAWGDCE